MEQLIDKILYWALGIIMLYTGFIWLVTRKHEIRMDSRIIGYTLILQGIAYTVNMILGIPTRLETILSLRTALILVCLAQSIPLTVSYVRAIRRGKGLE